MSKLDPRKVLEDGDKYKQAWIEDNKTEIQQPVQGKLVSTLRKRINSACFFWLPKENDLTGHEGYEKLLEDTYTDIVGLFDEYTKQAVADFITEAYGERCKSLDTHGVPGVKLGGICPVCFEWSVYDEWIKSRGRNE